MSMFSVTGKVLNVYTQDGRTDENGVVGPKVPKVQILGELPIPNHEETRVDLITLSVPAGLDFTPYINRDITVALGFFSPAKNQLAHYTPTGSVDRLAQAD